MDLTRVEVSPPQNQTRPEGGCLCWSQRVRRQGAKVRCSPAKVYCCCAATSGECTTATAIWPPQSRPDTAAAAATAGGRGTAATPEWEGLVRLARRRAVASRPLARPLRGAAAAPARCRPEYDLSGWVGARRVPPKGGRRRPVDPAPCRVGGRSAHLLRAG